MMSLAGADVDVAAACRSSVQMLLVSLRNQTRIWKRKSLRGQRADRADVDGVERVIVGPARLSGMDGQHGVAAALGEAEDRVVGDFVR